MAETAKEFGMTPEQLDRFVRQELGDPIVVDRDLIVGVRRDASGHVTCVQIRDPDAAAPTRAPDAPTARCTACAPRPTRTAMRD
jgi:hypothetical protein